MGRLPRVPEWLFVGVVWAVPLLVVLVFGWLLADMVYHGVSRLSWEFLTTSPTNAGREGGIAPILVATVWILLVALATALPLGLGTAILLAEYTSAESKFAQFVRGSLDVLAGVPSIVFGLFGNAFFCRMLGLRFSILSGGLTLACMILPMLIRVSEVALRSVPLEDRQAAAALGFSRVTTLWHILLPTARASILAGIVLSVGRALAETAALIFTSGYVDRMPTSVFDSGRALSVHVYELAMNVPGGNASAYASGLVLVGLLLIINLLAVRLADRWIPTPRRTV